MNLYSEFSEFRSAYNAAMQMEMERPLDWHQWIVKLEGVPGTVVLVACSRIHALTLLRKEHGGWENRVLYCRQGKKVSAP